MGALQAQAEGERRVSAARPGHGHSAVSPPRLSRRKNCILLRPYSTVAAIGPAAKLVKATTSPAEYTPTAHGPVKVASVVVSQGTVIQLEGAEAQR